MKFQKTILILLSISTAYIAYANDLLKVTSLKGKWKFSIGDNTEWAKPGYNDSTWEEIDVPAQWENKGFYGHDGYAWYRKKIIIKPVYNSTNLILQMGIIDDVDQVFFNGKLIGITGSFPPDYQSAYEVKRKYHIPRSYIRFGGVNTISVRVYDAAGPGGIISGDIGLFAPRLPIPVETDLQGLWKFRTGDDLNWKTPAYSDTDWKELIVPIAWENQGYKNYDGYAWYRKTFFIQDNTFYNKSILIMGKVDDIDEVYLNGVLIGATGIFHADPNRMNTDNCWKEFRGYYIPAGLLKSDQDNVIAVRVFDARSAGGIYEGPIGIVSQKKYIEYWRRKKSLTYKRKK